MQRTLTFCLPVFNEQTTLATTVAEILEVLPEITRRFEILVVDDGSTDATPELAHELATAYPQLRLVRHGRRLGTTASLARGVREATGEIVLIREQDCAPSVCDVLKVWHRIDAAAHRVPAPPSILEESVQTWVQRAIAWGQKQQRRAAQTASSALPTALRESAGADWRWADRDELRSRLESADLSADAMTVEGWPWGNRAWSGDRAADQPRRPAFLDRLRDFAVGE